MSGEKLLPETMGSGVAFLDYNGDGHPDLFFVNSCRWPGAAGAGNPTQCFYRNDGHGHFADVTRAAGLDQVFFGMGVAVGDYDNDGDPDLYVTTIRGGRLFRNDSGRFVDVTDAANAHAGDGWLTSGAFFDMENDGDLDLFLCSYVEWSPELDRPRGPGQGGMSRVFDRPDSFRGGFCVLLRNDGGKFVDVSEAGGFRIRKPERDEPMAKSLGVAPLDIDGDGLVDLAVANDTVPNFLFHNLGNGRFEEKGISSGIAFDRDGSSRGAMGIDWGDFRNDGSPALAVANFANEMIGLYVCDDPQSLSFTDMAANLGLGAPSQSPLKFGLFFFDYDLDGRLDLFTSNGHLEPDVARMDRSQAYAQAAQLYWNSGRKGVRRFLSVDSQAAGDDVFRPVVGRGCAYADIDGDGDLDVVVTANGGRAVVLRNDRKSGHHWLRLALEGKASNRDAIGAKVSVTAGGITQSRQLFPAKGYLSSSELPLTFGLGKTEIAEAVNIVWPSGRKTRLERISADRTIQIVEDGAGK